MSGCLTSRQSVPAVLYIGLLRSDGTEPQGAGYRRVRMGRTPELRMEFTPPDDVQLFLHWKNIPRFPVVRGSWGRITHSGLFPLPFGAAAFRTVRFAFPRYLSDGDVMVIDVYAMDIDRQSEPGQGIARSQTG